MKTTSIPENHRIAGCKIKIYPTAEQQEVLKELQEECKFIWNTLISISRQASDAQYAAAKRAGIAYDIPEPNYDGLQPEEAKATKHAFEQAKSERNKKVKEWIKKNKISPFHSLKEIIEHFVPDKLDKNGKVKVSSSPSRKGEVVKKEDYDLGRVILDWRNPIIGPALPIKSKIPLLQSLFKNYNESFKKGKAPPRFKKKADDVPLKVRTYDGITIIDNGPLNRSGKHYYDCIISFNGLDIPGKIGRKRYDKAPWELSDNSKILQGCTLVKEADGWYASITYYTTQRDLPPPTKEAIGIDLGLIDIAAMVDSTDPAVDTGAIVNNKRNIKLSDEIAGIQQKISKRIETNLPTYILEDKLARINCRAKREAKDIIYKKIIKVCENYKAIAIEDLNSRIGERHKYKSDMRLVRNLLVERYGDRVREVDCRYTSQDCSQCGKRSKESWSYDNDRYGMCPACGHSEHRDINAARNILRKCA
jgi:transposase